ncbi:MAG: efflux RND transporter periplasmic adaptor subunit [Candidatus Omnitrophica bacterium]|nr:efflux RND transporter periplasmic adaptor subunit [Candidatus Omnitrophota bacterium]MBU1047646.1 efflux RND transporter periplasmic adaptor subunit [Candidatus Omnitrophota bacterium]MBU1631111.1 efflux RND transporter periplasmic adaptor subunit [Candidatus Omnitrophota bacterium]MBU1767501.1 efflux RND transporter periplasmic adaptor subunit [Candidatus Omnitrophota bacterium]MBU1888624.1 efflux RND transporter periplasmic adaptor subunit [Candidatus Omnitrophota bacterium]
MRKITVIVSILLLGVIALIIIQKFNAKLPLSITQIQEKEGIPVEAVEIRPDSLLEFLNVTGRVGSEQEAYLSSKAGGRILEFHKDAGDVVIDGEKLVEIDTSSLEIQKTQAQNQVKIAENNLNQSQAQFEDVKRNLDRMNNLFKDGTISKRELEQFELNFKTAKQTLESAYAQLEVAKDNLRIVDVNIQDHGIFAPFDGVVGIRRADVGEIISPGQSIISLYNPQKLNAQVKVAEKDISGLQIGQRAILTLDVSASKQLKGQVTRISGAPDANTRLFDVYIRFEDMSNNIIPGIFLQGKILVDTKENIMTLSNEALIKEGMEYFVFAVEDNHAVKKQVKLGNRSEDKFEIISGIDFGTKIITFGKENVKEGSLIKIIKN